MKDDLRVRMFTVASGVYMSAAGTLDATSAHLLERVVAAIVQRPDVTTMAVDLSGIALIDAMGVQTLLGCREHARSRAVRFTLANPSPAARSAITACGHEDLLLGVLITGDDTAATPVQIRQLVCRRPPLGTSRQPMRSR